MSKIILKLIALMVILYSFAIAQTQLPTIYAPANGAVIEYTGSITNNVLVEYNNYGTGNKCGTLQYHCFNIYVDGVLKFSKVDNGPSFYLSLNPGVHTVTIELMVRTNSNNPYVYYEDCSVTFTVVELPNLQVSAVPTSANSGQNITFTASWTSSHSSSEIGWDIKYGSGSWGTISNYGIFYSLLAPGAYSVVYARVWVVMSNGAKAYSNECAVQIY
jgi:hypothetical protein